MIETVATDLDFSPMHDRMQWYIDSNIIPFCTTLVLKDTDVVGVAHLTGTTSNDDETMPALGPDTIFRMHSSTKLATSVLAMTLFEEGRFALDDPVATYLPEFADPVVLRSNANSIDDVEPAAGPILVKHILSHSAGLSYGFIEPDSVIDTAYNALGLNPERCQRLTLATLCEKMAAVPLAYQPGTSWRYSFATDVVARLTEVLSGQRFDELMSERVLEPLGMVVSGGQWAGTRILQSATLDLMRTNVLASEVGVRFPMWHMPDTTFGLGFALKEAPAKGEPETAIDEYHWGGMAGTHFWMSPRAGITGVCMTQRMPGFWHPFSRDFKQLVYEIAG